MDHPDIERALRTGYPYPEPRERHSLYEEDEDLYEDE